MADDLNIQRIRQSAIRHYSPLNESIGPTKLFQVHSTGSVPTTVPKVFMCRQATLSGTETEGGTYTVTTQTPLVPVVFLGPAVPAVGENHLARHVGGRWVADFHYRGTPPDLGSFLGCLCQSAPAELSMTVSSVDCGNGLVHACTLQYGPTPVELGPLQLGTNSYLSTSTFVDEQTGDSYYYHLSCFSSIFRVTRVFPTSIYGSPFLDSVVYYWSLGVPGNSCSPFSLVNGTIFFGGDPACIVEIHGVP